MPLHGVPQQWWSAEHTPAPHIASRSQLAPEATRGMHMPLAASQKPVAPQSESIVHALAHIVVLAQAPLGHGARPPPDVHVPVALHVGAGVSMPPAQTAVPQLIPVAIVQPVVLVAGSQTWQALDGLRVPAMKQLPKIAQMPAAAVCEQLRVGSSHVSVVHVEPSSHGVPVPLVQWSAPSQWSPVVQYMPSSH